MTLASQELLPLAVLEGAEQGGDVRGRWPWAEPTVWTERMLTALEQGVKGGRWYCLFDKVISSANLHVAARAVVKKKGAAGVDGQRVEHFDARGDDEVRALHEQLKNKTYRPRPVRRRMIPKAGSTQLRPLGIPAVRDRVVQRALKQVLEPIFERGFVPHSYGFRPGRSAHDALSQVDALLAQGFTHVVDADIESFFDRVDHDLMRKALERRVSDGAVLSLVDLFLRQPVMEEMRGWTPLRGTPQGGVLSPLLANIYLHSVDEALVSHGVQFVRYADDLVLLCRTREQAESALFVLRAHLGKLRLTLNAAKTRIVDLDVAEGFDFLGYHIEKDRRTPRKRSFKALTTRLVTLLPRQSGASLKATIKRVNPVLRGWTNYFIRCMRSTFVRIDGQVRRRLRAMLERRQGRGRGVFNAANRRWPNAYFASHGLYCCAAAHDLAGRSR